MKATTVVVCLLWSAAVRADVQPPSTEEKPEATSLFRSPNEDVEQGNARMAGGDAAGALAAYDEAAKALPNAAGVHLNRGLALLGTGELGKARTALQLATQPPGSSSVRADAYYNMGNAFYKEADALSVEEKHGQAQQRFREAVDAYKQSLRMRPGDEHAAWNLQLAARRVQEEQDKQEQNQDQQNQDQQNQDQQSQKKQDQQNQDQQSSPQDRNPPQAAPQPLPADVERALDALQDGEENLQRYRARQRARRERRSPEKDW